VAGLFHGFQLWVNLRPLRSGLRRATGPASRRSRGRVITRWWRAGPDHRRGGRRAQRAGFHLYADDPGSRDPEPGARLSLPWRADYNALVYVMAGVGAVARNSARSRPASWPSWGRQRADRRGRAGQESRSPNLDILILGGRPIGRTRRLDGTVRDEHARRGHAAMSDYQAAASARSPPQRRSTTLRQRLWSPANRETPTAPEAGLYLTVTCRRSGCSE